MSHEFRLDRRSWMQALAGSAVAASMPSFAMAADGDALPTRVLPEGKLPQDSRLKPLKDLNGYFPFTPFENAEDWEKRAEYVRRQIQVAAGVWPLGERPPVEATVHGRVDRGDYTVDKVFFESTPGLFVTGNVYRPKKAKGPLPAILCPHGHWPSGRFHDYGESRVQGEIKSGAEKYEVGGRHPVQARCVQLARMGCLVFNYDMLGYADSAPLSYELAHRFAKQRPELSSPDRFGLFSAQAELRLINALGLQTYNSLRSLDWLAALPGVDTSRLGITGSSGGGTQTFMLMAIDPRLAIAFPAVMVSTAMQGGCTCENATYLRVNTGNIEFAALAAPRPMAMSAANDWTRELETKGLPELRQHYKMLGAADKVDGKYFDFGHNYNYVSRAMMYEFFNKHLNLGLESPIVEQDYVPLTLEELSVWNEKYPKPACDEQAEVALMQSLAKEQDKELASWTPKDSKSLKNFREIVGGAIDVMVGRELPASGAIGYERTSETDAGSFLSYTAFLNQKEFGEQVPALFFHPKEWNKQVVVWVDGKGKAGLLNADGTRPSTAVQDLVDRGYAVCGVDALYQGEFLADGKPLTETPVVNNPREFAGFTLGYNHPLLAQRAHDVMKLLSFAQHHEYKPEGVILVGVAGGAPWALAAAAQARRSGLPVPSKIAVDTAGYRFGSLTNVRDLNFWPGAVRYGDVPALLALCAPAPLWVAGEGGKAPELTAAAYKSAGSADQLTVYGGPAARQTDAMLKWLS